MERDNDVLRVRMPTPCWTDPVYGPVRNGTLQPRCTWRLLNPWPPNERCLALANGAANSATVQGLRQDIRAGQTTKTRNDVRIGMSAVRVPTTCGTLWKTTDCSHPKSRANGCMPTPADAARTMLTHFVSPIDSTIDRWAADQYLIATPLD